LSGIKNSVFYKYAKGSAKFIEKIQNIYSTFKQRKNEPCLYTLFRYIKKIETSWEEFDNNEIKKHIKEGNLYNFFEKVINNLDLVNNFGIFNLINNRWINYE